MSAAMLQLLISSVVKGIAGRGVMTAGRGYYNKIDHIEKAFLLSLHSLSNIKITISIMELGLTNAVKEHFGFHIY